ncbi:hypothetical protein SAMN02745866_03240 [Alteromonadaceae bacterium Bs31]|nr:hypothetical protein SAMN02745866_03240 [Alteromonadaceae bacterium Bs31]
MKDNKNYSFPAILDFEASGFGSDSYPIEVGVVSEFGERYCALIQPKSDWNHWNMDAAQIHKIPRSSLVQLGKPVIQVCEELNTLLEGRRVYCDAWAHDNVWMIKLFHAAAMAPSFYLSPIESIITEAQISIWDDTKKRVQRNLGVLRHRASSDALVIQQTFLESKRASDAGLNKRLQA